MISGETDLFYLDIFFLLFGLNTVVILRRRATNRGGESRVVSTSTRGSNDGRDTPCPRPPAAVSSPGLQLFATTGWDGGESGKGN